MSYILDALKKSEEERKRGGVPDLHARHQQGYQVDRRWSSRPKMVTWLLFPLALATVIVFAWQWMPPPSSRVATAPDAGGGEATRASAEPASSASAGNPSAVEAPAQPPENAPGAGGPARIQEPPAATGVTELETAADRDAVVIEPAPLEEVETGPVRRPLKVPANVDSSSLPQMQDLPVERRSLLPEISIEGHVYAEDPARRMVMINKRVLREGEMAGSGIKLVRITWDGVVLRHGGDEFQLKIE